MPVKFKAILILIILLMETTIFAGYILVLKNGKKIYSDNPFEIKEEGVYFTLPNDMLIFVKRRDIDFEATKALAEKLQKKVKDRILPEKSTLDNSVTRQPEKEVIKETEPEKEQQEAAPREIVTEKTTKISDSAELRKTNDSHLSKEEPEKNTTVLEIPKTVVKDLPPAKSIKNEIPTSTKIMEQLNPSTKSVPEKTINKPIVIEKPTAEPLTPRKVDFGISVDELKDNITLEEVIELAKKVKWNYEGKCPVCGGTGKSPLSTPTNEIVCTYCNGTGKGGAWNDDILKIGDDCPWCVLGYDELGKGPCRHCMGTGRYLGLDRLDLLDEKKDINKKTNDDQEIKK
jgi:hypothetical protein